MSTERKRNIFYIRYVPNSLGMWAVVILIFFTYISLKVDKPHISHNVIQKFLFHVKNKFKFICWKIQKNITPRGAIKIILKYCNLQIINLLEKYISPQCDLKNKYFVRVVPLIADFYPVIARLNDEEKHIQPIIFQQDLDIDLSKVFIHHKCSNSNTVCVDVGSLISLLSINMFNKYLTEL